MENKLYEIYKEEIENIIKDEDTEAIFLVGSAKSYDLSIEDTKINDIDIFVFSNQDNNQIRVIKEVQGIEFDINYFSKDGVRYFVNSKEYFFLNEMKDAKTIYDKNNISYGLINLCKSKYMEGPNELSQGEKSFLKSEIESKIQRLKFKDEYQNYEYEFLTNLYLKDIIVGYFSINNKWIPKDKKIIKTLKKENEELFNLIQNIYKNYRYEDLMNVYNYVFDNITISKNIKMTY
ncbi:hypothetical protein [Faecalimicrobium dakarense]|uniref:hypothetical protein n=1 Tax=Faecalimicrobium dakarense TaxID=1301100 RepID=UPI0004B4BF95|nr:hypothetical protein [[Clostridium] dakarense]